LKLAKPALDFGLLTDDASMIDFFQREVGLGKAELLPIAPGVVQHRFDFMGSVIKVNVVDELSVEARSGYAALVLAGPALGPPRTLQGPDAVVVEIVRAGEEGVTALGIRLRVPERERAEAYFRDALGWELAAARVRVGSSVLLLEEAADAPAEVQLPVRGWTYMTVQIFDCDAVTDDIVARGAKLIAEAKNHGEVARFSMVADPWGNSLEISERSSVTGAPLGQARGPAVA